VIGPANEAVAAIATKNKAKKTVLKQKIFDFIAETDWRKL
jgi:hypothetical protein